MRVLVTGSTGYLGRAVTAALLEAGHEVVAVMRPGSHRAWPADAQVRRAVADVMDERALTEAMSGCDAVVHLVGIIREFPRQGVTMDRLHVQATQAVLSAMRAVGVERIVYVSALRARPDAPSRYHRSKWAAECAVREQAPAWSILRPSIIVGRGGPGPNFVRQLADLIQKSPVVPVVGDGLYLLQPVHIQDVARAVAACVTSPIQATVDLAGPHTVTYLSLLGRMATVLHRPLRTIRVPMRLMLRVAPWLERFPAFPVTRDQLLMLREGNATSPEQAETARRLLGFACRPITDEDLLRSL